MPERFGATTRSGGITDAKARAAGKEDNMDGYLVADAIIAFILSWYDSGYSFLKAILCTYLLGLVVMLIAVFIKPLELPVILEDSTSFSLLSGIVKVFLAVVLAFLPALAASVIGWIIREVYYVVSQIR